MLTKSEFQKLKQMEFNVRALFHHVELSEENKRLYQQILSLASELKNNCTWQKKIDKYKNLPKK